MDILNMHIAVDQGLQEINSFVFGGLQNEEVDNALNVNIERFMKTRYADEGTKYREGFEQSEKRFADLSNLSITDYDDVNIMECTKIADNEWKLSLPSDYFLITKRNVEIYYSDCDTITPVLSNKSAQLATLPFKPNKYSLSDFSELVVSYQDDGLSYNTIFDASTYTNILDYTLPESIEAFIVFFIEEVNRNYGSYVKVYYEVYKDVYAKDSFIFVDVQQAGFVKIKFDYTSLISYPANFITHDYTTLGTMTGNKKRTRIRITTHDKIDILKDDSFTSSDDEIILATTSGNSIKLYTDDTKFVPTKGIISYIKKPQKVSLALGINCELNSSVHQEIVDLTVAYLSKINANQNAQLLEIDTTKSE